MANIETLTLRSSKASEISYKDALKLLKKQFPKAKVAKLEIDPVKDLYTAHIIVAEFPPKKDDSGDEPPKSDGDSESESSEDDGGMPDFGPPDEGGGGEGEGGGKEDKLDQLMAKLDMVCQALGVDPMAGGDMGPPGAGGPPGMGPLPDVGAPTAMQPDNKPLPPPAVKQGPGGAGGGAAFARRTMTVWREDDGTPVRDVLQEAKAFFPGYRVAKIERHMAKGANGYEGPVLISALVHEA